jgi:hypothetical protein
MARNGMAKKRAWIRMMSSHDALTGNREGNLNAQSSGTQTTSIRRGAAQAIFGFYRRRIFYQFCTPMMQGKQEPELRAHALPQPI